MNKRVMISSFLGNALEFYDFTLYAIFASVFASQFFPSSNPVNSLLASWGAFGAGFLMRPFGATIFGYIGDKFGRKRALGLSIILMGIPTLGIGLLPNYERIGIFAPLLLITFRLFQGVCTGGEYNGSAIFAIETHKNKQEGVISGLITSSCVLGALTATGMGYIVVHYMDAAWGWRMPFILGALISFIGFFIRKNLSESPEFLKAKKPQATYGTHLLETLITNARAVSMTFFLGGLNGVLSYTLFGFLNIYLHKYLKVPLDTAMFANLFGLLTFMVSCPIAGLLMDRFGRHKFILLTLFFAITFPFMVYSLFLAGGFLLLLISQILYGFLVGLIAGPQHAIAKSFFPIQYRYTGVSLSFCTGMGICGGSTPLLATYLIEKTGSLYIPAMMVAGLASLTWLTYQFLIRHNFQEMDYRITPPEARISS